MTAYTDEKDIQSKLEKAAAFIIETSARETSSGNWITCAGEIPGEIISQGAYLRHFDEIVEILQEYEAVADIVTEPDGTVDMILYLAYCPNYEPHEAELDEYPDDREILDALKSRQTKACDTYSQVGNRQENSRATAPKGRPSLSERLLENKQRASRQEKPDTTNKITKQGERE
jgi:hypothetical protein